MVSTNPIEPASSAPDQERILVQANQVSVRFGHHNVLEDVDIAVHKGEIVTLIGLNGAGKSTLIRVLLGIVEPQHGEVRRSADLRIGYVPQHIQRDPIFPMTVRRFLTLGTKTSYEGLEPTLNDVGLLDGGSGDGGILDHALADISGGEMRRVLLARALLRKPDLLILDEPLAGVDISSQSRLYRLFATVRDRHGCGVLLVSHDLHIVMAATDTVVCLNRHICCTGHPQVVTRDPAFVALFGPQIAGERAVYRHRHDHRHDALEEPVPLESSTDHRHDIG